MEQGIFLKVISLRIIDITLKFKFIYNKKEFVTAVCRKEMTESLLLSTEKVYFTYDVDFRR